MFGLATLSVLFGSLHLVVVEVFVSPAFSNICVLVGNGYFIAVCLILAICRCGIFFSLPSSHPLSTGICSVLFDSPMISSKYFGNFKRYFVQIKVANSFSFSSLDKSHKPLFGRCLTKQNKWA